MPKYMLLIYGAAEGGPSAEEMPAEHEKWNEYTASLRDADPGLVGDQLHGVETATTVRVIGRGDADHGLPGSGRGPRPRGAGADRHAGGLAAVWRVRLGMDHLADGIDCDLERRSEPGGSRDADEPPGRNWSALGEGSSGRERVNRLRSDRRLIAALEAED